MLTDWNDDDMGDDNEDVADRWDENGYRIDKVRDAKEEKDNEG